MRSLWFCALSLVALEAMAPAALADLAVYVGYADNVRASPYFPNPWDGSPNTIFLGDNGSVDAGGILIVNNGPASVTLNQGSQVDGFGGYNPGPIWDSLIGSGVSIPSGGNLILTQTYSYNFDTSDYNSSGSSQANPDPNQPVVHLVFDGIPYQYVDSGQVLNTGGYDFATQGNESLQWRPIGTTGTENPHGDPPGVPEPGVVSLLGSSLLCLGGFTVRRRFLRR